MANSVGSLLLDAWRAEQALDPHHIYDEALRAVSERARADGCLGKADIGSLVLWKRITAQTTWAAKLMMTPDATVREVTGVAFERANDVAAPLAEAGQAARSHLRSLPGMSGTGALASAVLLSLAPQRMAIWDRRVSVTLTALGRHPGDEAGSYGRYLAGLESLAHEMSGVSPGDSFLPRQVDLALFHIGGSERALSDARVHGSAADPPQ